MRRLCAAVLFCLSLSAHAVIDTYEFADDTQREQFRELTRELRCPKCQNQDIADSNAPIAADLRREIHRLLGEGRNKEQIVDYMVDRYGEFVRYKPAITARTWLLWYGPGLLLGGGLLVLGVIVLRRRRVANAPADRVQLSEQERARLAALLKSTSADNTSND